MSKKRHSDKHERVNLGIHPRSWPSGNHEVLNTSKGHSKEVREKKIARMMAHQERHPNDRASVAHLNKIM